MRCEGALVVAMLALSLAAAPAHADPTLDTAKAAVEASDYLTARAQLTQLATKGNNSPEDMGEIYRLSGIVAGALNEPKAATEAFQRCLALNPKATLPPGTSPKFTRPFGEAQAYFKNHEPLKIKADTATSPPSVTITVVSDPMSMISRARVIAAVDKKAPATIDKPAGEEVTISLPVGGRIDLRVVVLDENGNRLAEVGSSDVPIVIVIVGGGTVQVQNGNKPPPPTKKVVVKRVPDAERPLYLQWWLWGGTSVAFAGLATYFAFETRAAKNEIDDLNAHSVDHDFDEPQAVLDRGKRDALFTNIGYGTAGAFAIVGAILYLTRPGTHEERVVTTTLTPVPVRGGGAIVLGVPF